LLCCGRCDHSSPLYCGGGDGEVLPRLLVLVVASFVIVADGFGGEGEAVHHADPIVAGAALPWSWTGVVGFVYSGAGTEILLGCCINHNSVSSSIS
jgi:hypothetical protein